MSDNGLGSNAEKSLTVGDDLGTDVPRFDPLESAQISLEQLQAGLAANRDALLSAKTELERVRRQRRFTTFAVIAASAAALLTAVAALAIDTGPSSTGVALTTLVTALIGLIGVVVGYLFGSRSSSESIISAKQSHRPSPAHLMSLVTSIADIEQAAARVTNSANRPRTVTQFIPELLERHLWDENDVQSFREALRVRNNFVHGQPVLESDAQLDRTALDLNRLLAKLSTAV